MPNTKGTKRTKSSAKPTASALNPMLTNASPEFFAKAKEFASMAGYCRSYTERARSTWSVTSHLLGSRTLRTLVLPLLNRHYFVIQLRSLPLLLLNSHCTSITDIDTRSGLKKIHKDFDTIQRTLNTLYAVTYYDKVAGAVVAILGKLADDGVLLRRIIKEAGMVELSWYCRSVTYMAVPLQKDFLIWP